MGSAAKGDGLFLYRFRLRRSGCCNVCVVEAMVLAGLCPSSGFGVGSNTHVIMLWVEGLNSSSASLSSAV